MSSSPPSRRGRTSGWSLRGLLRAFLYQGHRYEAGCPKTDRCAFLLRASGHDVACQVENGCPHFVVPEEPMPPGEFTPWLRRICRLDAIRRVGGVFHLNDLAAEDWTALIALQSERAVIEARVDEARERVRRVAEGKPSTALDAPSEHALAEARKLSGAPPPGGSLFGGTGRR